MTNTRLIARPSDLLPLGPVTFAVRHVLAAHVAAEVVLAAIERQGMVVMQKPGLPMPGVGPKGRVEP